VGRGFVEVLGSKYARVLDNKAGTMTRCAIVNVVLPLGVTASEDASGDALAWTEGEKTEITELPWTQSLQEVGVARQWMLNTMMAEYNTFIPLIVYRNQLLARISAQVYLDMDDFEFAGRMLKELCERVMNEEYKS